MIAAPFKDHLSATLGLALLYVALLTLGMAWVVFIGTTMGDCDPGPGCHDHDGRRIGFGILMAAGISSCFGAGVWLGMAAVRMVTVDRLPALIARISLLAIVFIAVWISFDPAMHLVIRLSF